MSEQTIGSEELDAALEELIGASGAIVKDRPGAQPLIDWMEAEGFDQMAMALNMDRVLDLVSKTNAPEGTGFLMGFIQGYFLAKRRFDSLEGMVTDDA